MLNLKSIETSRKSFLSSDYFGNPHKVRSPRFDKQKALQQQAKRNLQIQQKLSKYGQCSAILSAKFKNELDQFHNLSKDSSIHSIYQQDSQTPLSNPLLKQQLKYKNTFAKTSQKLIFIDEEKQVQRLREKNRFLIAKNNELKSNLGQITNGVDQLETILRYIESITSSLKQPNRDFNGLWFQEAEKNEKKLNKSQNNTKNTFDIERDKKIANKNNQNLNLFSIQQSSDNVIAGFSGNSNSISLLESRFKDTVQKVKKKKKSQIKLSDELRVLDYLDMELDKLKKNASKPPKFQTFDSQIALSGKNMKTDLQQNKLIKVKSLNRIIQQVTVQKKTNSSKLLLFQAS